MKMEEFVSKLGIRIDFTQASLPWSNGVNERNHYSCDIIVNKVMEKDKNLKLQTAVNMASWTHNTNVNVLGYSPLQLVTGKSIVLPGLTNGNVVTDSEYDDEAVRKIMERHYGMLKEFRELEFSKKLKKANEARARGYEDKQVKNDDIVYYQNQDKKAWLGPVKVCAVKGRDIFIFANGGIKKVPRCNIQLCESEDEEIEEDKEDSEEVKKAKKTVSIGELPEGFDGENRRVTRSMT